MRLLFWRRCREHHWFPGHGAREFIVTTDVCMDCDAIRVNMPYGTCLNGHPIAQHYNTAGALVSLDCCEGPL